jgi:hypothetical protein
MFCDTHLTLTCTIGGGKNKLQNWFNVVITVVFIPEEMILQM